MRLLDRYLIRNFLEPFLLCFFGFIAIWLIFDLSDNGSEFIEAHASSKQIALFYLTQLPQMVLISLPVGLLLALLFCLSRMSRSNEIISMLCAGQSVIRVLSPLLVFGVLASLGCMALNYELAPHAEATKKVALEQLTKSKKKGNTVEGYLFRDRMNNRTWFIKKLHPNSPDLFGVHITQQGPEGDIIRKWYATRATFEPKTRHWVLKQGMVVDFTPEGKIAATDLFPADARTITDWTETPWRILSSRLEAQSLSVPELEDYLRFNGDFPDVQLAPYRTQLGHRWALPWNCLVVALFAAPLGLVFSRRAVLAGVASSIFIFFGLMFVTSLCTALGKGSRIPPLEAAWFPNAFFALIGLYLLYLRSTNRDLPTFGFGRK